MFSKIESKTFVQDLIRKKEFAQFKKKELDKEEICETNREKEILNQQMIIKNYINPHSIYKKLLVMWGTGSGKSLGGVLIAENFRNHINRIRQNTSMKPNIYIISSAEAHNNFKKELFGDFIEESYISPDEKKKLKNLEKNSILSKTNYDIYSNYKNELEKRLSNPEFGGYYEFMGYTTFQNRTLGAKLKSSTGSNIKDEKGEYRRKKNISNMDRMDYSVLIFDEAHEIEGGDWGKSLELVISKSKGLIVILLTATPMIDKPIEIVQMLNFLLPDNKKLKKMELFENDIKLKPNADKIIGEASKGYVSYFRGFNPNTFPMRVDKGKLLNGFKELRLIPCVMEDYQLKEYQKIYKKENYDVNDLPPIGGLKSFLNMILPTPDGYGIYKKDEINTIYRNVDPKWLEKMGIEIKYNQTKDIIVSGSILNYKNIGKYSSKFKKLISNLWNSLNINGGTNFIYNDLLNGIGINLIEEILLENGFEKYNINESSYYNSITFRKNTLCVFCRKTDHKKNNHTFKPAKFISLTGELEHIERNKVISLINNIDNKDGAIIKIILGSEITSQSIDLKRIREVHITTFENNISKLNQIIGRGIRHCSHLGLPKKKWIVDVYRYCSVLPNNKPSKETEKYLLAEKKQFVIKNIERQIKINSFDCYLNKIYNMLDNKYNYTEQCDYTKCHYHCSYEPKNKLEIDKSTYDLYYYAEEIKRIKKRIIKLFTIDIIWNYSDIKHKLIKRDIDLIDDKYIWMALNELIEDKTIVINQYGYEGFIIYVGEYYLFQPLNNPDINLDLVHRLLPFKNEQSKRINLRNFIETGKVKSVFNINEIIDKLNKIDNIQNLGKLVSKLPIKVQTKLIEDVLEMIIQKQSVSFAKDFINYYKPYLLTEDQLINSNYTTINTLSTDSKIYDNSYIGHIFGKNIRCYTENGWSHCEKDITKTNKKVKENNLVIGIIDKDKNNNIVFKLRPPIMTFKDILDRRKIAKGFVCESTSNKKSIIEYAKMLDIIKDNIVVKELCKEIEDELRRREIRDKGKVKWLYEIIDII